VKQTRQGYTCLDLFCGAGGKSLGFERAGFDVAAAVDIDPHAVVTFRKNFPHVPHVFERDLIKFPPEEMAALIGRKSVDVIIGGPPCQGFSNVRRRDGKNHGDGVVHDARRGLYKEFLRYVAHFRPKVFVMENVPGLRTAVGGHYFNRIRTEAEALGYRLQVETIHAADFGVPQKRRRIFFFGIRTDLSTAKIQLTPTHSNDPARLKDGLKPFTTLGDAIMDLPALKAGEGKDTSDYDMARRNGHPRGHYLYRVLEANRTKTLTGHQARPHNARDLRDFARLREGENSKLAEARGVKMEFPYSRASFHDRYTRQHRHRLCSTIVAHLGKDGLMFIHPTQNRSLTPREAARVQSFPDWFQFPVARTHAFRLIGNAVPPLVSETVAGAVGRLLLVGQPDSKV
jgi:DNA (cytosine-5)-methyltransferase 1